MKISNEFPPNWNKIKKALPAAETSEVLMTYGDTIYNPFNLKLREDLIFHESVHSKQQGNNPAKWLKKYLADPKFRIEQEIQAYGAQLAFIRRYKTGPAVAHALKNFAKFAASSVYGSVITEAEAMTKISKLSRF